MSKRTLYANPGGGGASDHGALTGLGDDDHPQYESSAEAQAKVDAEAAARAAADSSHAGTDKSSAHPGTVENGDIAAGTIAPDRLAFDPATQAELDAHASAGDPHTGYLRPGEPLAPIVATEGGVGYEGPDNVPIHAFRKDGDTEDRVRVYAGGIIQLGNGVDAPGGSIQVRDDGVFVVTSGGAEGMLLTASPEQMLAFHGASPIAQPAAIADVTAIADPPGSTAEDVANKLNELIAVFNSAKNDVLEALGLMAS